MAGKVGQIKGRGESFADALLFFENLEKANVDIKECCDVIVWSVVRREWLDGISAFCMWVAESSDKCVLCASLTSDVSTRLVCVAREEIAAKRDMSFTNLVGVAYSQRLLYICWWQVASEVGMAAVYSLGMALEKTPVQFKIDHARIVAAVTKNLVGQQETVVVWGEVAFSHGSSVARGQCAELAMGHVLRCVTEGRYDTGEQILFAINHSVSLFNSRFVTTIAKRLPSSAGMLHAILLRNPLTESAQKEKALVQKVLSLGYNFTTIPPKIQLPINVAEDIRKMIKIKEKAASKIKTKSRRIV